MLEASHSSKPKYQGVAYDDPAPNPRKFEHGFGMFSARIPNTLPQGHDDIDVPTSELLLQSDPKPPNPKPRTGRTLTVVRVVGSKGRA